MNHPLHEAGDVKTPSIADCIGHDTFFGDPVPQNNHCVQNSAVEWAKGVVCTPFDANKIGKAEYQL